MNTITQTKATVNQIKLINCIMQDAIEKVLNELDLNKSDAHSIIEYSDELAETIRITTLNSLKKSVSEKLNKTVSNTYSYFSGYKPRRINWQMNRLNELFPNIGNACEKIAEKEPPKEAEGWFAIPKWQSIAPTYCEATEKVLSMLRQNRNDNFNKYFDEGTLGPDRLRQTAKSEILFEELSKDQEGHDVLIVPAQFGLRYRGNSVRSVRKELNENEAGLGIFAISIMLLTHPERLQHQDDLWIDCAGDEEAQNSNGDFSRAPYFRFRGSMTELGVGWIGSAINYFGSATAFSS